MYELRDWIKSQIVEHKQKRLGWILPSKMKIHKSFIFRNGRAVAHDEPFAKRREGKLRRQARKFHRQFEHKETRPCH